MKDFWDEWCGVIIPMGILYSIGLLALLFGGNKQEYAHIDFKDGSVLDIPGHASTAYFSSDLNVITKKGRKISFRLDGIKSWYTFFK